MAGSELFIFAENLKKTFTTDVIPLNVFDLNLSVTAGETISILGISGTGKSTLLNILGGIDQATSGHLRVADVDLNKLSSRQLTLYRRNTVGFIFQFYNLIPSLTAKENVSSALEAMGDYRSLNDDSTKNILNAVGLSDKSDRFPEQLSGGEQQRVAIARALVKKPPLILADEPTGNLDPSTGKLILELLVNQAKETGATLIIVTHNPEVGTLTDRALSLVDGKLIEIDPVSNA